MADTNKNSFKSLFDHPVVRKMPAISCQQGKGNSHLSEYLRACLLELTREVTRLADRVAKLEEEKSNGK